MTTQQPSGWYPDPTTKAPFPESAATAGRPAQQPPGNSHLYKNPVLYAIGGLFFPPLVLFLMGGNRTTCAWIAGLWLLFWLTIWLYGLGVIFAIANYIWSIAACYQEAVKQNQTNGLA